MNLLEFETKQGIFNRRTYRLYTVNISSNATCYMCMQEKHQAKEACFPIPSGKHHTGWAALKPKTQFMCDVRPHHVEHLFGIACLKGKALSHLQ